jgi:hypothetical protein
MDREEAKLRIVEAAMRYVGGTGADGVLIIAKKIEDYIFNADKVVEAPAGSVEEPRKRLALKTKETPSNS